MANNQGSDGENAVSGGVRAGERNAAVRRSSRNLESWPNPPGHLYNTLQLLVNWMFGYGSRVWKGEELTLLLVSSIGNTCCQFRFHLAQRGLMILVRWKATSCVISLGGTLQRCWAGHSVDRKVHQMGSPQRSTMPCEQQCISGTELATVPERGSMCGRQRQVRVRGQGSRRDSHQQPSCNSQQQCNPQAHSHQRSGSIGPDVQGPQIY